MTVTRKLFTLVTPPLDALRRNREDPYHFTREKIARNLFNYTLIDSYKQFKHENQPYPFVMPSMLRPGSVANFKEFSLQNSAFVILMDGTMPKKLRKHFRFRDGNRLCKENLLEVAPDLPGLEKYTWRARFSNHKGFDALVRMLLPMDYSLLVQRRPSNGEVWPFELSHFHVKIERLLDNAIRSLAIHLNYLERGLYERGEAFVDLLEKKFFEYFNFHHNASGRRCAAALAAQLLARENISSTIYVSSQQTRCLTFLTTFDQNDTIAVEQYILLDMEEVLLSKLKTWGERHSIDIKNDFLVGNTYSSKKMLFRARYEHTEAGSPSPNGQLKSDVNFREKWVRLKDEALVPVNPAQSSHIACSLIYRRSGVGGAG